MLTGYEQAEITDFAPKVIQDACSPMIPDSDQVMHANLLFFLSIKMEKSSKHIMVMTDVPFDQIVKDIKALTKAGSIIWQCKTVSNEVKSLKNRKNKKLTMKAKAMFIILLIPVAVTVLTLTAIIWTSLKNPEIIKKSASALLDLQDRRTANENTERVYSGL